MEWISVKNRPLEYNPMDVIAFKYFFRTNNERYYSGYAVLEYGETRFFQYNGIEISNVTHWIKIEPPRQKNDMEHLTKQIDKDLKIKNLIFEFFNRGDNINVPLIQRKCKCGYFSALRVFENLIENDQVNEKPKGSGIYKIA